MGVSADAIMLVHFAWVLFIVMAVPLIVIGKWRGWRWVYNWYFRHVHLAMIGFVILESWFGIPCPLTVWEHESRIKGGQAGIEQSFLADLVHSVMYYRFPEWVFTLVYTVFGVLIVWLYVWVRPTRRS